MKLGVYFLLFHYSLLLITSNFPHTPILSRTFKRGVFFSRGKLSWEESFSPHPFQRTCKLGFYFLSLFLRSTAECAMFAQHRSVKVFVHIFGQVAGGWGEKPHKYPPSNAGEGEFLCFAKKEGEPSSGVLPFYV